MRTMVARSHTSGGGSQRSSRSHEAIITATLELLREVGYASLTIEGIAARAGVGKTTIYRWWSSKGELVGEALSSRLVSGPEQETGDFRRDLRASIEVTIRNYAGPESAIALLAFAAHVERDTELLDTFRKKFLADRRKNTREMLVRAVERGDLPEDVDLELMMDVWAGAIFYRSHITGEAFETDLADRLTEMFVSGGVPRRPAQESQGSDGSLPGL